MPLLGTDVELDGGLPPPPRLSAADASACYPTRARAARAIVVGTQRERHQLVGAAVGDQRRDLRGNALGPARDLRPVPGALERPLLVRERMPRSVRDAREAQRAMDRARRPLAEQVGRRQLARGARRSRRRSRSPRRSRTAATTCATVRTPRGRPPARRRSAPASSDAKRRTEALARTANCAGGAAAGVPFPGGAKGLEPRPPGRAAVCHRAGGRKSGLARRRLLGPAMRSSAAVDAWPKASGGLHRRGLMFPPAGG